jgi:hypothetical protein
MSSLAISTEWLLAMLAAVALAARPRPRVMDLLPLAAGLPVAFAVLTLLVPQPGAVGLIAAWSAAWRLLLPGSAGVDRALAGVCAGGSAALYAECGLSRWLAVILAAGTLALAVWVAQSRPGGARSGRLPDLSAARDPVLFLVALSAGAVGLAPDILAGWHSATLLNRAATPAHAAIPVWAVAFAGVALLTGVLRGVWIRR